MLIGRFRKSIKRKNQNLDPINSLGEKTLNDTMKLVDVLKMKITKPKFWDKNIGIISILLIPITIFLFF